MQHRRDVRQLADSLQSRAAEILGSLVHQSRSGGCLGGASGEDQQDIVLNEFLHQFHMSGVRTDSGIVASHHGNHASDDPGGNAVNERLGGSRGLRLRVGHFVQLFDNGLHRVSYGGLLFQLGNMYQLRLSVHEVLHSGAHDFPGVFARGSGIKADEVRIRHLRDGRGRDEFGVETLAQRTQRRENTLYVHHNGFAGSGEHYVLLLQEVSCHGYAAPHSDLIRGTAYAGDIDPLGTKGFRQCHHLRIFRVLTDHL